MVLTQCICVKMQVVGMESSSTTAMLWVGIFFLGGGGGGVVILSNLAVSPC